MRTPLVLLLVLGLVFNVRAEPEFPLAEDSKPHAEIPHGELIKGQYTAKEGGVFPGTERDFTIYLPAGFTKDKATPTPPPSPATAVSAPTSAFAAVTSSPSSSASMQS